MSFIPSPPIDTAFNPEIKRGASTPLNNNDARYVYSEPSPMNTAPFFTNPSDGYNRFGTVQPEFNPIQPSVPMMGTHRIFQPQYDSTTISAQSINYPTSSTQNNAGMTPLFGISTNQASHNISNFMNNPFTSYALNYTAFLAKEGAGKFNGSSGWFHRIKKYFDVDNRYVIKKLLIILFPFLHRDWACSPTSDDPSFDVSPKKNTNFPDLYIPLMAFWTSMVLYASILGYKNIFHPNLLSIYISSCCGMFILELLFFTVMFYLTGYYERYSLLQMTALCGYKYVPVVEGILAYFVFGNWNFFFLLYVSLMFVLFICRNSRLLLMPSYNVDNSYGYHQYSHSYIQGNNTKRLAILSVIGILQPLQIYYSVHKISSIMG